MPDSDDTKDSVYIMCKTDEVKEECQIYVVYSHCVKRNVNGLRCELRREDRRDGFQDENDI